MSKSVALDHESDLEKFSILLNRARGTRTQSKYAEDCKVSLSYISKLINQKMSMPPIPSTIRKFASHAENDVTYEDLMDAAGYDSEKHTERNTQPKQIRKKITQELLYGVAAISNPLIFSDLAMMNLPPKRRNGFDIGKKIENSKDLNTWYFKFISGFDSNSNILQSVYNLYGMLAAASFEEKTKISIFTNSEDAYELIREIPPVKLPIYMSVILTSKKQIKVIREEYLETMLPLTDELKTKFNLNELQNKEIEE